MREPSISVIVPAYNEALNLPGVIAEIATELAAFGRPYVRVVRHNTNRGLGGVYRTGFQEARSDYVTFLPGDGQFAAAHVPQFAELMAGTDMVLGYLPASRRPLVGRLLSWCEHAVHRVLLGKLPRFQGILMFRRSLLSNVTLHSDGRGWGVLFELILKVDRAGYRVRSVPTEVRPRLSGRSKVNNVRTIAVNLLQVFELRRLLTARLD
jgi:glycosyltransferase involved in cell wall biosynthesis